LLVYFGSIQIEREKGMKQSAKDRETVIEIKKSNKHLNEKDRKKEKEQKRERNSLSKKRKKEMREKDRRERERERERQSKRCSKQRKSEIKK
jgi:hypothetical protein